MIQQCDKCHIVHDNRFCPLCSLRKHNNLVHDFIESNGQPLVRELVTYLQMRKAPKGGTAGPPQEAAPDVASNSDYAAALRVREEYFRTATPEQMSRGFMSWCEERLNASTHCA